MKKRIVAMMLAVVFSVIGMMANGWNVKAAEIEAAEQEVDISTVMTEDALIGYAPLINRGVYLLEGVSALNDAGGGKIGWGGITNAVVKCKVSVNAIVERKVDGSWVRVTSSTTTNTNAYTAVVSKTLSVASGYQYRVRCVHSANTDTSSSFTGTLWM